MTTAEPVSPPAITPPLLTRGAIASTRGGGGVRLGLSLADQGVVSVTNFGTTVLLGRLVSEGELGRYGMAMAALLLATEAHNALVSTPHQVLLARRRAAERPDFNGSALVHSLVFGVVVGTLALAFAAVVGSPVALAFAAVAWAVLARQFVRIWCFTNGRPGHALAVDAVASVLQLGGLGVLWATDHLGPASVLLAIGVGNSVALAGLVAAQRREFRPAPRRALADLRRTWPLSRWVFLSGVVWTLGTHGYPWLIGILQDAHEVGIWTACFAVAALANPILMGVQNFVGPAVAAKAAEDPAGLRRYVAIASIAFGLAMTPYVAFAWVAGEPFLRIYGEGKYEGNGHLVGLLSLATLAQATGFAASRGLFAVGRARHDFLGNVLALCVMAGPGAWLIHTRGVAGAAVAIITSLAVGNGYRVVAFFRAPVDTGVA